MRQHHSRTSRQSGVMLIEAMIAILIFSIGVLGIISMQGAAARASTDAKYRSEASLLANELIGRMWAGDRSFAGLQANFASPNGIAYKQWAWEGTVSGAPGTAAAPAKGTVFGTLPQAGTLNAPSVTIKEVPPPVAPSVPGGPPYSTSLVTITIFWQMPGADQHQYIVQVQIGG